MENKYFDIEKLCCWWHEWIVDFFPISRKLRGAVSKAEPSRDDGKINATAELIST